MAITYTQPLDEDDGGEKGFTKYARCSEVKLQKAPSTHCQEKVFRAKQHPRERECRMKLGTPLSRVFSLAGTIHCKRKLGGERCFFQAEPYPEPWKRGAYRGVNL
jgi:hypothetical protein